MPGIFGICDFSKRLDLTQQVESFKEILRYNPFFDSETVSVGNTTLGRVGLGMGDKGRIRSSDEHLAIVLHGQIFNLSELAKDSSGKVESETILNLHRASGSEFVSRLKGSFVLAIWDQKRQTLSIGNDRFGTRPLYYLQTPGIFAFSSEMKALLTLPQLKRKLDYQALAEFFSFGLVLENKTLLNEINLLPPGSSLTVTPESINLHSYWKPRFSDSDYTFGKENSVEECHALLDASVKKSIHMANCPGLFLSGGLDSRLLAGLAVNHTTGLQTFTFGTPDSLDVHLAAQIANTLKTQHHCFDISPDFLLHWAEKGVWYTEGMSNCLNFAGIEVLPEVRQKSVTVINGYGGNEFLGFLSGNLARYYYLGKLSNLAERFHRDLNTFFTEPELGFLLQPDIFKEIRGVAYGTLRRVLNDSQERTSFTKLYNFMLTQKARRLNLLGIIMDHSHLEYSLPFYDYDFADFALSLPPRERLWARFYRYFLTKKFPRLSQIPYQRTGLPVTASLSSVLLKKALAKLGISVVGKELRALTPSYLDYPNWTRRELKPFILSVLRQNSLTARHLFNQGYVDWLLDEHFSSQREHSAKIGLLLTFEIWYRQFMERGYPS